MHEMSMEKFLSWIDNEGKPLVCGNCVFYGPITRYCHCKTNKRVKKRIRHNSSPKCSSFAWKISSGSSGDLLGVIE